ncbi:uncharacterized protein BHQ10_005801 [Talaromyces amestolkiae]|uniref:Zn(2)-C6 fungal-type domain-containing protein n=1 Tax=Talaromyces amestolkiae TaxID=1196081 RepID=A0A364L1V1_TALAM|nr:uncharacterized protein BHQ10_005801 [Talaromyces amestolkiae]RAO69789.1 hypothetical protein BHQ10_005801 [Talaromyces amestolkiae]
MPDTASGKVKASRASAPKRRTGCGTCKIRHKRCDEAKPICQNCSKTGRVCDGYIDGVTGQQYGGHPTRTSRSVSPLPRFSSPGLFNDQQEAQGFRFFIDGTGPQLGVSMGNKNWSTPLLQLGQQNSAIRHAAIAVGIMSKRFEANELSVTADAHAKDLSSLALTQYSKAIGQLRLLLDTSPGDKSVLPHNALACCILLMLFEFLQGNADGVRLHLANAVKLTGPAHTSPLGQHLLSLLVSLDMASVLWLNLDRAHTDASLPFPQLQTCAVPLQPHANLETLCYELAGIGNDIMAFSHNVVRTRQRTPGSGREDLLQIQKTIQSQLDLWYQSFSNTRPTVNDVMESRHFLLRANYLFLTLKLDIINIHNRSSAVAARKKVPHESRNLKLTQFSEILDLAEAALETKYPSTRYDAFTGEKALEPTGLLPLFSFRTSFILPIFFVAQNGPDTNLRWRAVRILSERPWREGAWDSAAMAAIAERSLRAQTPIDP